MKNETPRRNRLDLNTPAEVAIYNAMQQVEEVGADVNLTEAVTLLSKAKDLVSDYVDKNVVKQNIMDRVKTFEDACNECEISSNMKILLDYNGQNGDMIASQAHMKLTIIARALNEGWKPNWNDPNEYKYYGWFKYKEGSGFSLNDYNYTDTLADVGSRLCFKTRELAEYAAKQFESIYNDFLNN